MKLETYNLPTHWACALINGDESGLDDDDSAALNRFSDDMVKEYGQCWALSCDVDTGFMKYHDAQPYGVLACDCLEFTFDVTRRD